MSANLTTRYLFKAFAGISSNDDDALIDALINPVCVAIAAHCERTFEATTYRSWLDGSGHRTLLLPQWPITRLYSVSLSGCDCLRVKHTGSTWADVTCDGTLLRLHSVSTAAVEDSTDITLAGSTLAQLEALVEAVSGWSVEVQSTYTTYPAILLRPAAGLSCVSPDTADFQLPDDPTEVRISQGSNQGIELPMGQQFACGSQNVFAWYTAGYTLPADDLAHSKVLTVGNVPTDLTMAANNCLKAVIDSVKRDWPAMNSETIANYSYTMGESARAPITKAIADNAALLEPYRNARVV